MLDKFAASRGEDAVSEWRQLITVGHPIGSKLHRPFAGLTIAQQSTPPAEPAPDMLRYPTCQAPSACWEACRIVILSERRSRQRLAIRTLASFSRARASSLESRVPLHPSAVRMVTHMGRLRRHASTSAWRTTTRCTSNGMSRLAVQRPDDRQPSVLETSVRTDKRIARRMPRLIVAITIRVCRVPSLAVRFQCATSRLSRYGRCGGVYVYRSWRFAGHGGVFSSDACTLWFCKCHMTAGSFVSIRTPRTVS